MRGEWGHLDGKYPEKPNENEEKIRGAVDLLKGTSISDLTAQINVKKDEKKVLDERLKYVNFSIEVAERALKQAMDFAGFESVVSNGYMWTPGVVPYPSVEDNAAFLEWAHAEASETLTMHSGKMATIVKACLESNEPLPPGVKLYLKPKFSRTAKES